MTCPLCQKDSELYEKGKDRSFYECSSCHLIFVPRESIISPDAEKTRYDSHENEDDNSGYQNYLSKIASSIRPHIHADETGLDFGSGKTTLLAELLRPNPVASYDLYFHPDDGLLKNSYDFIILSEVIEHLREPLKTMKDLRNLTGKFFIKTKFHPENKTKFSNWFYKRDITHVQFFNESSYNELGKKLGMNFGKIGDDLYLFKE